MSRIVVIGGTGLIGSKVVSKLTAHGHDAVPASPKSGVDTITGAGLAEVLEGADTVLDVSNSRSFADDDVMRFFTTATTNIVAAAKAAGVGHYVALSVVGSDRLPDSGYMRAKLAQEKIIRESGIPYSVVHATQFFEFAASIADGATVDGTVRLPHALMQPIAAEDVATAVARTTAGSPVGAVEVGGPEKFGLDEFVRTVLTFRGDPRPVVADPDATYFGQHMSDDMLVAGDDATISETRLEEWLPANPPR